MGGSKGVQLIDGNRKKILRGEKVLMNYYGFHREQMEFAGMSRSDYLRTLRQQQATEELERKDKKAKRRGGEGMSGRKSRRTVKHLTLQV